MELAGKKGLINMLDRKHGKQTVLIIVNAIAPYCFELNNVLAMPTGFIYRFRYRRFWMPTIADPNKLAGLPLLILLRIFESGELIPLREATIERISEVGDVVHIEYRLGEIVRLQDEPASARNRSQRSHLPLRRCSENIQMILARI